MLSHPPPFTPRPVCDRAGFELDGALGTDPEWLDNALLSFLLSRPGGRDP